MASEEAVTSGYECSLIDGDLGDLQSECSVCLHILREPCMVGCCGYRFCRNCIEPIQKASKRCPLCNDIFMFLPDKQLNRILRSKMVYCSNRVEDNGCQWEGNLANFEEHLKTCTWQKVPCPHCHQTFTRYSLNKVHIETCPERKIPCTYCKTHQDTQTKLESVHYAECPMYPVACPNDCGAKPFRKNITKHIDDSCPRTIIECFFKHAGCDVQLPRAEMKQHADSSLAEHLAMSMSKIAELNEEISSLKQQLEIREHQSADGKRFIHVTNLPGCVNGQMLRAVFGQYGSVSSVYLKASLDVASIEYSNVCSVQRALLQGKEKKVRLKSQSLCLSPAFKHFDS